MITPEQLKAVFPACMQCGPWVRIFNQMVDEFDLRPDNRFAMWLAQCGYESDSFRKVRESMSYTAARLIQVWPKEFPTLQSAAKYERNPAGLANYIYANRNGNGDEGTGDGLKFRGGGLIELTGRANYSVVGKGLNLRLDVAPQMIEQPIVAARTAGYFWKMNDLNAAADAGDFDYTTRKVNGKAMLGAADRKKLWQAIVAAMKRPSAAGNKGPAPGPVAVGTLDGVMTPGYRNFEVDSEPTIPEMVSL